ncbi:ABC transporter ATP-binding protein [Streptococcus respiraculi]|uniref:ABC transporter ATP-binding protein n=1 Tax=Streptococcus respiraculi TaxID=2021971 RepID=UPI000E7229EF|nr:ABC transporter ATP-binding protein [Streptococcus respiraculi]
MTEKQIALKVEQVSKSFRLPTESTQSLRTSLVNYFRGVKGYKEQHVLEDVSFEVEKGDFFGIIGRNGSGKSTLLKVISQIYTPESGKVTVNGTLVPFIELGVGFNPELTGRENVYLNGALLGFSREEIAAMYDDIVEFAELEEFMDQKLKNYSSGMQVRLAFSIAIKAQGDILILDEVLAVGDEAFQRKCFDYFRQLKEEKKTVILVTHSMDSAKKFCNKAIMLEDGKVVLNSSPDEVANYYTMKNLESRNQDEQQDNDIDKPWIKIELLSKTVLSSQDMLKARISYYTPEDVPVSFGISLIDENTDKTSSVINDGIYDEDKKWKITSKKKGIHSFDYELPLSDFNNRNFELTASLFQFDEQYKEFIPYAFIEKEDIVHFAIRGEKHDNGLLKLKGNWER